MIKPPSIMIISFMLLASIVHSQTKIRLKTNAKDTLTISEMFTTGSGVGEGVRAYKILGRKFAYEMGAVDERPQFLGGERKFKDTLNYKAQALYPATQTVIIIEFVIDYYGKPTYFKFIWSKHPDLDKKLINFITSLPRWTPGIKNNKFVRVKFHFQYR